MGTFRLGDNPEAAVGDYTAERDNWSAIGDENFDDNKGMLPFALSKPICIFEFQVDAKENVEEEISI